MAKAPAVLRPDTGVMLNNMMGEDDLHPEGFHASPPGMRVASMMAPSLLSDAAVRCRLALGSGGSKRIRTALLQADQQQRGFRDAAARRRWPHRVCTGMASGFRLEPGFGDTALAALEKRWPLNRWPAPDVYFGGVHVAAPRWRWGRRPPARRLCSVRGTGHRLTQYPGMLIMTPFGEQTRWN
jgi:gamma-glutamyltranspeptidase/glutathione hydrolase